MSIEPCIKITFLGNTCVGKTSIINRLINKNFDSTYEATSTMENYSYRMNLNEEEVVQKTYVNCILEDCFGLDNSLLNKPEELIASKVIRDQRDAMKKQFRDIMFTSTEKRNQMSTKEKVKDFNLKKNHILLEEIMMNSLGYSSPLIERSGFVFVCDCESPKSVNQVVTIIEKLQEIEKTNNLIYPKMILFNKSDKMQEKTFKEDMKEYQGMLENFKAKFKIECVRVSALTGNGIVEAFTRFLGKIHQEKRDQKQNDGITEPDDENDMKLFKPQCVDNLNMCTKNIFCGNKLFSCGAQESDEEIANN